MTYLDLYGSSNSYRTASETLSLAQAQTGFALSVRSTNQKNRLMSSHQQAVP